MSGERRCMIVGDKGGEVCLVFRMVVMKGFGSEMKRDCIATNFVCGGGQEEEEEGGGEEERRLLLECMTCGSGSWVLGRYRVGSTWTGMAG